MCHCFAVNQAECLKVLVFPLTPVSCFISHSVTLLLLFKLYLCMLFTYTVYESVKCILQSLRNGFVTCSRLIHVNHFVSHVFLNFFKSWHEVRSVSMHDFL